MYLSYPCYICPVQPILLDIITKARKVLRCRPSLLQTFCLNKKQTDKLTEHVAAVPSHIDQGACVLGW
jgi:hypothetical protein